MREAQFRGHVVAHVDVRWQCPWPALTVLFDNDRPARTAVRSLPATLWTAKYKQSSVSYQAVSPPPPPPPLPGGGIRLRTRRHGLEGRGLVQVSWPRPERGYVQCSLAQRSTARSKHIRRKGSRVGLRMEIRYPHAQLRDCTEAVWTPWPDPKNALRSRRPSQSCGPVSHARRHPRYLRMPQDAALYVPGTFPGAQ